MFLSPFMFIKNSSARKNIADTYYWCVYVWRFTETGKKVKKADFPHSPRVNTCPKTLASEMYALKHSLGGLSEAKSTMHAWHFCHGHPSST